MKLVQNTPRLPFHPEGGRGMGNSMRGRWKLIPCLPAYFQLEVAIRLPAFTKYVQPT